MVKFKKFEKLEKTKGINKLNKLNKMKKIKSVFLICSSVILLGSLSGCASLNSSFDCKKPPLVMCKSLDQVNTMVNRGQLGRGLEDPGCPTCSREPQKPIVNMENIPSGNFTTPYPQAALNQGDPLRYGETVMRIWVASYQDDNGNYYQPSELYTVIKPGYWINHPPKAVVSSED